MEGDGLDDKAEGQYEGQERDVEGAAEIPDFDAPVHQGGRGQGDRAPERGEGGRQVEDGRDEEPDEGECHRRTCKDGDGPRRRHLGLAPPHKVGGKERPQHGPLDGDRRQPRQRHGRPEAGERQAAGAERQKVGEVGDGQQQRGGVRQVGARVGVWLGS